MVCADIAPAAAKLRLARQCGGWVMRRIIMIAVTGASLGGCSSFSLDAFRPTPPTLQVQLDSVPPGADARTSLGPGCKTPCSAAVKVPEGGFSVTYTLDRFQPMTIPVQVIRDPGDASLITLDPNPVVAELQPAAPPPKTAGKKIFKPKKPKAAAAAPTGSPFPAPPQTTAPQSTAPQTAAPAGPSR
jgi:hypothetical protein